MIDVGVYLDKRRMSNKGYPVKLRVKSDGACFLVSTGLYAENDLVDGRFTKYETGAQVKNVTLLRITSKLQEELLKLGDRKMSPKMLKDYVDGVMKGKKTGMLVDYIQEYMNTITVYSTRVTYNTTLNKVRAHDPLVRIEDVDFAWLTDFETAMKKEGYRPNYYGQMERNIRTVFNYCIDRGYTENYPFRRFKTKSEKTVKRAMSIDQVRQLMYYHCQPYQREYIDMFMLTIFMQGISPVDLFNLPHYDPNPGTIIDFKRKKDGAKDAGYVRVVLTKPACDIIKRYEGKQHLLNVIEDRCKDYKDYLKRWNQGLKKVGQMQRVGRGGKKVITPLFPWLSPTDARHTYATLLSQLGVSKYIISLAMGHAEAGVTDIYINPDYKLVARANQKLIDWIFDTEDNEEASLPMLDDAGWMIGD